jgi:hypothetical protein
MVVTFHELQESIISIISLRGQGQRGLTKLYWTVGVQNTPLEVLREVRCGRTTWLGGEVFRRVGVVAEDTIASRCGGQRLGERRVCLVQTDAAILRTLLIIMQGE